MVFRCSLFPSLKYMLLSLLATGVAFLDLKWPITSKTVPTISTFGIWMVGSLDYQTLKCTVFRWIHILGVRYFDPLCIWNVFLPFLHKQFSPFAQLDQVLSLRKIFFEDVFVTKTHVTIHVTHFPENNNNNKINKRLTNSFNANII